MLDEFVKVMVCVVSTAVALAENEAVGAEFTVMVVALEFSWLHEPSFTSALDCVVEVILL